MCKRTKAIPKIAAMHQFIKAEVKGAKVLYGDSVKPENIKEILTTDAVDGVLVGGASIDPASWSKIVQSLLALAFKAVIHEPFNL